MGTPIQQVALLEGFTCLGSDCPDTCCRVWGMQTDSAQRTLYEKKAPELLGTIDPATSEMKRDTVTQNCLQLRDGLCGIQQKYGSDYLSDACHFFPRMLRRLQGEVTMTATLACPEIARLVLTQPDGLAMRPTMLERLPGTIVNPVPKEISDAQVQQITQKLTAWAKTMAPDRAMQSILHAAYGLQTAAPETWPNLFPTLLDEPLPVAETKFSDPYTVFYGLMLFVAFTQKQPPARLGSIVTRMEAALGCTLDWQNREISAAPNAMEQWRSTRARWASVENQLSPALQRWIQAQLGMLAFPFGPPERLVQRITLMAHHYAFIRLALMCHVGANGEVPDEETIITIIQSTSRVMNHLSDMDLQKMIYRDAGWMSEERMLGVIAHA